MTQSLELPLVTILVSVPVFELELLSVNVVPLPLLIL